MAAVRAFVCTKFQEQFYITFRHHCTDRSVWTPDTCRNSVEAVPHISVLSNSHSVINTSHGPYKLSYWKHTPKTKDCWHTCVLVTFIRTYIYGRLYGYQQVIEEFSRFG